MSIASGLEEVSIAWSDKPGSRQGGSICSDSRGAHALMSKFSSTFNVSINNISTMYTFCKCCYCAFFYWPFCGVSYHVPYCAMLATRQHV